MTLAEWLAEGERVKVYREIVRVGKEAGGAN